MMIILFVIVFDGSKNLLLDIIVEGEESEDTVFSQIVAVLPPPLVNPPEKDAIPQPSIFQVFRKPLMRTARRPIKNFEITRVDDSAAEDSDTPVKYRWVVQPNSSVQLRVKFRATSEGKFESALEFEVMNTLQKYSLFCKGICELPKINDDTRNVFLRRQKGIRSC